MKNNEIDASGILPPCVVAAGGLGALNPPHSSGPEGHVALSAAVGRSGIGMSVGVQLAPGGLPTAGGLLGKMYRPRAAQWDTATISRVRQMAADGLSTPEAAAALGIDRCTMRYRSGVLGIKFDSPGATAIAFTQAAQVLREHWGTNPDSADIYRRYTEVLGWQCSMKSMYHHAHRIGATRGAEALVIRAKRGTAARLAQAAGVRVDRAARLQELMNTGIHRTIAGRMLGYGDKATRRMLTDGLITIPPRVAKIKPPKVVRVARVVVVKKPKPPPVFRPVAPSPPLPPPPVFQTVEEWLASGNKITRCPTAMATYTPNATLLPEDSAAMAALHAERIAAMAKRRPGDAWRAKAALITKIRKFQEAAAWQR